MKKVCSLICLIMMLMSLALPAGAEENCEDSVTISEDVLSCLEEGMVDTVFRVYDVNDGYDNFVRYGDMDGVLANTPAERLQIYYFVKNKQGEASSYTYDGTSLIGTGRHPDWGAGWFAVHSEKTETVIKKVAPDIVVENVYYLWVGNWFTVYYETNLGDYVYIDPDEMEYLMGLEQFTALQAELTVLAKKRSFLPATVGCPPSMSLVGQLPVDMSPYDINSPDFDPHAPLKLILKPGKLIAIGLLVLLVALVVGRFLIRGHRKYRAQKDKLVYRY